MAHFLPPELVRQVNKLEWPKVAANDKCVAGSSDKLSKD